MTNYNRSTPLQISQISAEKIAKRYKARKSGDWWRMPCPAHGGTKNSLAFKDGDNNTLAAVCHSHGCEWRDIMHALNVPVRKGWSYEATYNHDDGVERNVFRKDTKDGKNFESRGKREGTHVLTYGEDSPDDTLVIVEGEKAARALQRMSIPGITPVSFIGGAKSAGKSNYSVVKGRNVILWPDNDETGWKAMQVVNTCAQKAGAKNVRILDVSDLPEKGDAADIDKEATLELLKDTGTYRVTTLGVKQGEVQALIAMAAHRMAKTGDFMFLFDEWWQKINDVWVPVDEQTIDHQLHNHAYKVNQHIFHDAALRQAKLTLKQTTAPPANRESVLPRNKRNLSFNLDTGATIKGVVYGQEIVSVDSEHGVETKPVNDRDFVRSRRGYQLEEAGSLEDTPKFREYLKTTFGNEHSDNALLLTQYMGRILAKYMADQKFMVLLGPGGAGKGTAIRLIELLVGEGMYTSVSQPRELGKQFQTYKLVGKDVLTLGDIAQRPRGSVKRDDYISGVAIIKSITGQDEITIEEKRKEPTSGKIDISIIGASNHMPEFLTSGKDASAWKRRMLIVKFPGIENAMRTENLSEQIFEKEGPRIASLCLWRFARTTDGRGYVNPASSQQIMGQLIEDSTPIHERYIEERLVFEKGHTVTRAELDKDFLSWCENEGVTPKESDKANIKRDLRSRGLEEKQRKHAGVARTWVWVGGLTMRRK